MEQVLEMEQMEMEGNEFEEMSNTESVDLAVAAPHVNKVGQQTVVAFLAGLGTGLAVGAALWFSERNKRLAILEQLEMSMNEATAKYNGTSKVTVKKPFRKEKEVDLAELVMNNPHTYKTRILENVSKVRWMKKSERDRWEAAVENITTLTIAWYKHGIANDTIGKEIPQEETTEVLKESK